MSEENSNLRLWNEVCKTPPEYTKTTDHSGAQLTSIKPMYQIKKATELFGPQGLFWGIDPTSERFLESTYGETCILSYDAVLFFYDDEKRGEIPIHASMKIAYKTKNGYIKIDEQARKKVVTDAKTKGLSELGFSADVFLGFFNDPVYVSERNFEQEIETADNRSNEIAKKVEEFKEWFQKELSVYPSLSSKQILLKVSEGHIASAYNKAKILQLNPKPYTSRFEKAVSDQLKAIEQKNTKEKAIERS